MAKQVVTTTEYLDDISGTKADKTVTFGYDGQTYEIDLSKANIRAFDKAIAPYVGAARKVRATRSRAGRPASRTHDVAAIRGWARANGYDVSGRGRIAAAVIEAYQAAK